MARHRSESSSAQTDQSDFRHGLLGSVGGIAERQDDRHRRDRAIPRYFARVTMISAKSRADQGRHCRMVPARRMGDS